MKKHEVGDRVKFFLFDYPGKPVIYENGTIIDIGETEFIKHYIYKVTHPDFILHVNGVWIEDYHILDK